MFTLAQPTFYPCYNPYEELLAQQELQRRRQVEAYLRRQREVEELERRIAYQRAIRQAEYERQLAAEYERRRRAEMEWRRSMYGGGLQELLDAMYGNRTGPMSDRGEQTISLDEKAPPSASAPGSPSTAVPEPADVKPEAESVPEAEQTDEDATTQIDTVASLAAVQSILASLETLQSNFEFPSHVDFVPSSGKLAYTPNNAPVHGYEHALTGLLTQLDAVESYGDEEVRRTRKDAVKLVERELERVDGMKAEALRKQSEPAVAPAEPQLESEATSSEAPSLEMEVDPAAIPLPEDFDAEDMAIDMEGVVPKGLDDSDAQSILERHSVHATPSPSASPVPAQLSIDIELPPASSSPAPHSTSLNSPSPSDSSDDNSDADIEEYVDVEEVMSASSTEPEDDADLQQVEADHSLEAIADWDLDF